MRNSYLHFIVFSLLCLANTALGQAINEKLFFSTIEPAISPMVSHMLEDRRGYIWFCTSTGLFRYDGTDVQSYKIDPSNDNALPSWPMYMAEAPDGTLWISTHGGGLSRLDPMTRQFEHFYHDEQDPTSIAGNIPQFLTVDEEGFLWIGFDGEVGLDRFDPATRTFRHFRVARGEKGRLQGRVLGNILADQRVLQRHRAEFFEVDPYRNYINSIGFRSMLVDRYGLLWSGVNFFNPQSALFEFHEISSPKSGQSLEVRGLLEISDSIIFWVMTKLDFYTISSVE